MFKIKKSREKIKKEILLALNKKPLSIQQLSKRVGSNWSTVNEVLYELKEEGKVREIISTDKIKFYQKNIDTYYNIPISEKQKKGFTYLFSLIIDEYKKKKNRLPNRTELAKTAVATIEHEDLMLNLPTVWYIYGKIPLMVCDPSKDYPPEEVEDSGKIKKVVSKIVLYHMNMNARELKKGQYEKYDNSFYLAKEGLLKELSSLNKIEKVEDLLSQFYIECPSNMPPEVFDLVDRFFSVVNKMIGIKILKQNKVDIVLTLDTLWKYITINEFLESVLSYPDYNKREMLLFYLGPAIETKKYSAEEAISNLESIYFSELNESHLNTELSEGSKEVREMMADWTGD